MLAPAAMLAVARLARGDAGEADGPHEVELVAFVAEQAAGEIDPQLRHCHWGGMGWVWPCGSITLSCFPKSPQAGSVPGVGTAAHPPPPWALPKPQGTQGNGGWTTGTAACASRVLISALGMTHISPGQ